MNERRWLVIILALYVFFALGYSLLMPPWEGPDEPAHYILAVNLARVGIFSSIKRNYEAGQPQTYYRLASIPLTWLYRANPEWVAVVLPKADYKNVRNAAPIFQWSDENYQFLPGLYLLRWLNIFLGSGALGLNYLAMRRFREDEVVPIAALALAALTPQFLHTTSSVANDTLGILAGAFLFWVLSRVVLDELNSGGMVFAWVAAVLLPYGTKLTVFPMGATVIVGVLVGARARWPRQWGWLLVAGLVLAMILLVVLILLLPEMGAIFWQQVRTRAFFVNKGALTPGYLWNMVSQVVWSYWGKVGWLAVGLPGWMVVILTGLGCVGAGAGAIQGSVAEKQNRMAWRFVWFAAGLTIAAVLKNGLQTVNSQGRFLFPAIGALALIMVSGWQVLLPARFQRYILPAVLGLMIAANLTLWFGGIIPVYYQPF